MTDREKCILTAYTGVLMTDWDKFHQWIEEFLGEPVWSHEFASPAFMDYIAEKVKPEFLALCGSEEEAVNTLEDVETEDVAPVAHAHWCVTDAYPHNVYCSKCLIIFAQTHWPVWEDNSLPRTYCPSCGAKMDEEDT